MKRSIAAATLLLAGSITACGSSSPATGGNGSNAAGTGPCAVSDTNAKDGGGASLKVGSKSFAEEELLATITKKVLEKHNFSIDATTKAADPAIDQALRSGGIDMLWQYTGTELQGQLGVDKPPTDLDTAFKLAQTKDAAGTPPLCWVAPAKFDDTNGIAVADTGKFGTTLSDFSNYLGSHSDVKVCIMSEFRTRSDGVPGLDSTYGHWKDYPGLTDIGSTAEKQLASKQCDAGEVFTTDSGIAANNLKVLTDDKKLFPPDNVGLIVRADVLKAHPAIANLMAPVAQQLTNDVMTGLNKKVEIDGQSVDKVAQDWLSSNNLLQ